jgi:hypothetical protein
MRNNVGVSGQASIYQSEGNVTCGLLHPGTMFPEGEYNQRQGILSVTNNGLIGEVGNGRICRLADPFDFSDFHVGYERQGRQYTNNGGYMKVGILFSAVQGEGRIRADRRNHVIGGCCVWAKRRIQSGAMFFRTGSLGSANQTFTHRQYGEGRMLFSGGNVSMATGPS